MKTSQKIITLAILVVILVIAFLVSLSSEKRNIDHDSQITVSSISTSETDSLVIGSMPDIIEQEKPLVPKDHMETLSTGTTLLVPGYIMFIKEDYGESFWNMSDSASSQSDIALTRVEFHKGDKLSCDSFTFERCTKYRSGVLGVTSGTGQGKKFYDYLVKEGVYKK